MDDDRQAARLWRVYKTVHEMVNDRGYTVSQGELGMTLDGFRDAYARNGMVDRQALTFLVQKRDDPTDQLLVFFTEDETVGIKPIKKICERMISQSIMKGILVYQKNLTPSANKVVQEMAPKYHLELFQEAELLVNITHHVLVPQHEVLSAEEKKTLLQRYRLKETQLPRIQPSDPVARYYGVKRGQVMRIVRPSETAGKYVTYRLCY
ncbi:DNA-directed RNA polymerases II 24 kDa polypeptide (RNA polymerase II subunit 5) [Quaeritorhiza haematococci]|nr:DNA-directed RNA polymerases II 24 kDa polypeptide (RNA polymerase II subunit 5) [Quaeritorhiza haematococci]